MELEILHPFATKENVYVAVGVLETDIKAYFLVYVFSPLEFKNICLKGEITTWNIRDSNFAS